jgi:hypothetical protein
MTVAPVVTTTHLTKILTIVPQHLIATIIVHQRIALTALRNLRQLMVVYVWRMTLVMKTYSYQMVATYVEMLRQKHAGFLSVSTAPQWKIHRTQAQ